MGDFIERYIFPAANCCTCRRCCEVTAEAGLEALDVENLRPHYARTLWAWSDRRPRLEAAQRIAGERRCAYRLYLGGSAMSFEQGWISLHQMLASRPDGDRPAARCRAQSVYPFNRGYIYPAAPRHALQVQESRPPAT